jgi:Glycosyl hydrolases family 35/Beta-galactosidase jelly roll domain
VPVTYDRSSFLINGERVFLTSGSIHPFRVPRALWHDRLEKARNAGLNAIQFYVAWNWHETEPGKFDFKGERDLDHFMTLAIDLGLYLVARPGPYICAEWEFGGFPPWLMQIAGIQLRHYDPLYLRYVDRYFEQVLPLIAKHQIDRPELQKRRDGKSGGVIMVQAENELNLVSPGDAHPYMQHLIDLYRRMGITVPIITCEGGTSDSIECVNSHTPADRFARYRKMQPTAPLHCTEFWSGWYGTWDRPDSRSQRTPAQVERETWRILAHGGAGYNYYMWHGGTNFGYTTMYLNTTSYDYGAPLGEAGGLWDKHHRCRRVSLFAQTFADILTTAQPGDFSDMERDLTLGVHFFQRVSPQGNIVFIENPRPERIGVYLYINGISQDLFVAGESVRPVVYNVPLGNDGEGLLALCTAGVLGRWTAEDVTQLVVYGGPGVSNRAIVALHVPADSPPKIEGDLTATWRETERPMNDLTARSAYNPDNPDHVDGESLPPHLKAMDAPYAALTDDDAEETLIERASQTQATPEPAYAPGGMLIFTIAFGDVPQIAAFVVNGHTYRLLALPTSLADRTWWAGGRKANGKTGEENNSVFSLLPSALFIGANTVQTSSNGVLRLGLREEDERLWRYENGLLEGVSSPSTVTLSDPPALTNWAYCDGALESLPEYDDSWAEGMYAPTNRVLLDAQPGYAWYRTIFDSAAERATTLTFTAFADRILIFLNGEWIADTVPPAEERVADPSLTVSVKLKAGRNVLAVLTDNLGHVKGEWQFRGRPMAQDKKGLFGDVLLDFSTKLHNWRFLPGLTLERGPEGRSRKADVVFQPQKPLSIDAWNWQPAQTMQTLPASKRLRWYRATFSLSPKELTFAGRELLLDLTGLHKGVVWVNGTNLGRYWTTNGHTRAYVPKCWLANTNTLLLFEETDATPFGTRLVWDDRANIAAWKEVE